jgi:secreted protein with Ig-like and vWFA domain
LSLRRPWFPPPTHPLPRDGMPLDAWDRPEDDQAVIVVASWVYIGAGHETEGERWLALSAAARAREQRRIAREELTTTTASAVAA